jgi:transglutaminase-like putative cysteine protease
MKTTEHLSVTLGQQTLNWLSFSYLLMVLPLYGELHPAIYACALLTIGWRYAIAREQLKPPSLWLKNSLALLGMGFIAYLWRSSGFLPAMFNLLVLGCTLKFLEFSSRRHLSLHVLSLYFLVALALIYHQGLAFTIYLLLVAGINTIALLSIYQTNNYRAQWQLGLRLLLQSLPLMAVLFLLIPHLGPMWRIPDIKSATTGLNEEVTPGDIAQLSRSSELAFRASFDGPLPPENQRYWRALVHEEFDGETWRVAQSLRQWYQQQTNPFTAATPLKQLIHWQGPSSTYRLIVEPSNQHWLYSLDLSRPDNDDALLTPVMSLYSPKLLQQKKQIPLSYFPQTNFSSQLNPYVRQINLQLPQGNPQVRTLAAELRLNNSDDREFAQATMRYFASHGFSYTLEPPTLQGSDQIDDFMFGSRRGFCAHFASSFTFLMRAAGIPARMVTGYLGGEYHADDNYLSLYQFDAHAWSEVWLDNRWQRFDPTLMVAPDRLSRSIDDILPAEETRLRDPFSLASYRNLLFFAQLHQYLAAIDYRWTSWVLNYNNQSQEQLLRDLFGNNIWGRLFAMLGGLVLVIGLALGINWLARQRLKQDPLVQAYQQACHRLAKQGFPREPGETPLALLQRLQQAGHPASDAMQQITETYLAARYAGAAVPTACRNIKALSRQLK